jgi:hypothetical protein
MSLRYACETEIKNPIFYINFIMIFYINFIMRYKTKLSLQTPTMVGPKSNLEVSDEHHTKKL